MELSDYQFKVEFKEYLKRNIHKFKINNCKFNVNRIDIPLNSIWKENPYLVKKIFSFPEKFLSIAENCLNQEIELSLKKEVTFDKKQSYLKINLLGPFGYKFSPISSLGAFCLGELICVKGSVIYHGKIKIKRYRSIFYCNKNLKLYLKDENENNIFDNVNSNENGCYSSMEIEHGLSVYAEQQKIIICENPWTNEPMGSQKNLIVYLNKDLVNNFCIGDELEVCGLYKPLKLKKLSEHLGLFETHLSALSIKKIYSNKNSITCKLDFLLLNYFSMFSDCFDRLSSLIIPQINGFELMKKSILLSLVYSNTNKDISVWSMKENINLLLIGDFELMKNELFSFISKNFYVYLIKKYEDFLMFSENIGTEIQKNLVFEKKLKKIKLYLKNKFFYFENLENLSYRDKMLLGEILEKGFEINDEILNNSLHQHHPSIFGWAKVKNKIFNFKKSIQKNLDFPSILYEQFDLPVLIPDVTLVSKEKIEAKLIMNNHLFTRNQKVSSKDHENKLLIYKNYTKSEKKKRSDKKITPYCLESVFNNFLTSYLYYARSEIRPYFSKDSVDFLINNYYFSKIDFDSPTKRNIRIFETAVKLCLAFTKCHLREEVTVKDVQYIKNFLKTIYDFKFQLKINKDENYTEFKTNLIKEKESKSYFLNKKKINKYLWMTFELKKPKILINRIETWDFKKIHITSHKIKKKNKGNSKNSFLERASSIWNYKNICIIIAKDLIKIN